MSKPTARVYSAEFVYRIGRHGPVAQATAEHPGLNERWAIRLGSHYADEAGVPASRRTYTFTGTEDQAREAVERVGMALAASAKAAANVKADALESIDKALREAATPASFDADTE